MGLFTTTNNHYTQRTTTQLVPYEKTVIEKRAPTDESLRLLTEMEGKVKDRILTTINITDNQFNAVGIYYIAGLAYDTVEFHIRFSINGKEYTVIDKVPRFEWRQELSNSYRGFGNEAILRIVFKKISEIIALELLRETPEFCKQVTNIR